MKRTICITVFALLCSFMISNALPKKANDSTIQHVQQKNEKKIIIEEKDEVSSLTLAVNAINNIMAWSAGIVAILTLIVAVFGFIGYNRIKEVMNDSIKKNSKIIDDKIKTINEKEEEFSNCISRTKIIDGRLKVQEKYMCNSNLYLYESLDKIANQISDTDKGRLILKEMLHNYQVTNLYSADNNTKFASLAYLQANGTFNDIEHLEYVSNYDQDENNKIWSREIIGAIKHKKNN